MTHREKEYTKLADTAASNVDIEIADAEAVGSWPLDLSGIELSSDSLPSFPLDLFPEQVRAWVLSSAARIGTPPDYIAITLLCVVSSLLGRTRQAQPSQVSKCPPFLWSVLVGSPSTRRWPAMQRVLDPLLQLQDEFRDEHGERHQAWLDANAEIEERNRQLRIAATRGIRIAGAELPDAGPEPLAPQFVVEDATSAGLEAVLERNPRGVFMVQEEIAALLSSSGTDTRKLRRMLLKGFDATPYRREKANRAIEIDRFAITFVGTIQPAILSTQIVHSAADSLASRFFFIFGVPADRDPTAPPPEDETIVRIFRRLASLDCPDPVHPHRCGDVTFSEAAVGRLNQFRLAARERKAKTGGMVGSLLGEAPGSIVRLAMTLRYLDWAYGEDDMEPEHIERTDVERAGELFGSYLMKHARTALFSAEQSAELRRAAGLLAYIRKTGEPRLTRRMLMRADLAGLSRLDDLDDAILRLESAGALRWTPDRTLRPQGGRPSHFLRVHPDILAGI